MTLEVAPTIALDKGSIVLHTDQGLDSSRRSITVDSSPLQSPAPALVHKLVGSDILHVNISKNQGGFSL